MLISHCLKIRYRRFLQSSGRICATYSRKFIVNDSSTQELNHNAEYLSKFLRDKIKTNGPITVADYMHTTVSSSSGYYSKDSSQIFGERGDFVTSPELTQMFGELVAIWSLSEMHNMGHTGAWQLIELGPGTGTLCNDILKTLHNFNAAKDVSVAMVESSQQLALRQQTLLCPETKRSSIQVGTTYLQSSTTYGNPIAWHQKFIDVPHHFSIIVAHEFFDALPVHCFKRNDDGVWREILVDCDFHQTPPTFQFILAHKETFASSSYIPKHVMESNEWNIYEFCPQAQIHIQLIGQYLKENGGAALIVDYGHMGDRHSSSLRAYRHHKLVDPLSDPGQVDVTADVNFDLLKTTVMDDSLTFGPITQATFLRNMGIDLRMQKLMKKCKNEQERSYLNNSYNILMSSSEMGEKFKVFSVFPKVLEPVFQVRNTPVGFQ